MNGQKIFVKGNHDKKEYLDKLVEDKLIQAWYDYRDTKISGMHVAMFHYPISSWDRQCYGAYHLHGHCHGSHGDSRGRMLDVGLDSAYNMFGIHKFFTENEIHEILGSREIYTADHHKERN